MKSIRNVTRLLALAAVAALMFVPRAEATSIVVDPHFQIVADGSQFTVDIDASGFSPNLIGGASFRLAFNQALISGVSEQIDPTGQLAGATANLLAGFAAGPGLYDAYFISSAFVIPPQTDPFPLVRLTFVGIAPGLSGLNLSVQPAVGVFLTDDAGNTILTSAVNGCVLVTGPAGASDAAADPCPNATAVPEPATFGLLATGLATVLARRRRKTQA